MPWQMRRNQVIAAGAAVTLIAAGCANEAQSGAVIGAGAGAIIGQLIGGDTEGTLIGAGIGALIGGGIGTAVMAQRARELESKVDTAGGSNEVAHIGEKRGKKEEPYEVIVASLSEQDGSGGQVLFDRGQVRVSARMARQLDPMVEFMGNHPDMNMAVIGHSDTVVPVDQQVDLSHRRADAVAMYLMSRGVPAERIVTRGAGAYAPLASNETAAGRAKNRRVDLVFYKDGEEPPEVRVALQPGAPSTGVETAPPARPQTGSGQATGGRAQPTAAPSTGAATEPAPQPAPEPVPQSAIRPAHELADMYTGTEEGRAAARAQQSEAAKATDAPPVSPVRPASDLLKTNGGGQ